MPARKEYSKDELEGLVAEGLTIRGIAERLGCATMTVQRHLTLHGLATSKSKNGPKHKRCGKCGETDVDKFEPCRYKECRKCRTVCQKQSLAKKKEALVDYKGGKCEKCGYDKYIGALHFHHLDPTQKEYEISSRNRSLDKLKEEVDKCILVCANCHAELHA